MEQPDFDFDEGALGPPVQSSTQKGQSVRPPSGMGEVEVGSPPYLLCSTWQEVPQTHFLSWSEIEQLAYCAARDENSAAYEDDLEIKAWYLAPGAMCKAMITCLLMTPRA